MANTGDVELAPRLEHDPQADRLALLDALHPLAGGVLEPGVDQPTLTSQTPPDGSGSGLRVVARRS